MPGEETRTLYYVHTDHLGTPQVVTDGNQVVRWRAVYAPFGGVELVVEDIEMPVRFPGQYFDGETGLHYNYFRDYDASLGRYVQSDPIGLGGGVNTYSYAHQNTLVYFDRYGLISVADANAIGSAAGGFVGGLVNGAITGGTAASVGGPFSAASGAVLGAVLGGVRGASTGFATSAFESTLGPGGGVIPASAAAGVTGAAASVASTLAGEILPGPAALLAGGAVGGAIGGSTSGVATIIGGGLGGFIGGAIAAALCFGDLSGECVAELEKHECPN